MPARSIKLPFVEFIVPTIRPLPFNDRAWLFEATCRLDLEGIVAKRKQDGYGGDTAWYKIKNPTYTQAEGRRELFERG